MSIGRPPTTADALRVPDGLVNITYTGPDGGAVNRIIGDGEVMAFGSSGDCGVRIGYAPTRDRAVPGIAGRLLTIGGRLVIECAEIQGYRALEVIVPGEPTRHVPLGEAHSPRARSFVVVVAGGTASGWRLETTVRRRAVPKGVSAEPTGLAPIVLDDAEMKLLAAYSEPLRRGLMEPATHRQVASTLFMDYNTARSKIYKIYDKFFEAELPMPAVADKLLAVVECARLHGVLEPGS